MNISKPTEINFDNFQIMQPNLSNYASNMIGSQFNDNKVVDKVKDRNIQINLLLQSNQPNIKNNNLMSQIIDLDAVNGAINLTSWKGRKIIIEVTDDDNIIINQIDSSNQNKTSNTSNSKDIMLSNFKDKPSTDHILPGAQTFFESKPRPSNYI